MTAAEDRLRTVANWFGRALCHQVGHFSHDEVYQTCFRDSHKHRPRSVDDSGVAVAGTRNFLSPSSEEAICEKDGDILSARCEIWAQLVLIIQVFRVVTLSRRVTGYRYFGLDP